jgi:hypothetical protein
VRGARIWEAALGGGLAAGIVGALVEDSGPVLLVVAVFALGCVLSYLWAAPVASGERRTPARAGLRAGYGPAQADPDRGAAAHAPPGAR